MMIRPFAPAFSVLAVTSLCFLLSTPCLVLVLRPRFFASAWVPPVLAPSTWVASPSFIAASRIASSSQLGASGGFGAGSGGSNRESAGGRKKSSSSSSSAPSKETKLKPKQQWDRYMDLKASDKVRVGVRVCATVAASSSDSADAPPANDWLEVGHVKSAPDVTTEVAVARQRALIAEHAKRLFPLQLSTKDRLEWGYCPAADGADWVVVDKAVLDGISAGSEKRMGFEGTPDPATGYYCVYNEGRLVSSGGADKDGNPALKPSSKRLQ